MDTLEAQQVRYDELWPQARATGRYARLIHDDMDTWAVEHVIRQRCDSYADALDAAITENARIIGVPLGAAARPPVVCEEYDGDQDAPEAVDDGAPEPWVCPQCGSDEISVYYDERHVAGVVDRCADDPSPWPSPTGDEFVDLEADSFAFISVNEDCNAVRIEPCQRGDAVSGQTNGGDGSEGRYRQ